eukprot:614844-Pyramimonas_sp.AAC.1
MEPESTPMEPESTPMEPESTPMEPESTPMEPDTTPALRATRDDTPLSMGAYSTPALAQRIGDLGVFPLRVRLTNAPTQVCIL